MEPRPEYHFDYRSLVAGCALPSAPIVMPEQVLARPRERGFLLPVFRQWLIRN